MEFKDVKIQFIKVPSIYLHCQICQEVFTKPVVITCSHTFCETCIQEFTNCPLCNVKIDKSDTSRDIIAYKVINSLDINCPKAPHCDENCRWKGNLMTLGRHIKLYKEDQTNDEYKIYKEKYERTQSQSQSQNQSTEKRQNQNSDLKCYSQQIQKEDTSTDINKQQLIKSDKFVEQNIHLQADQQENVRTQMVKDLKNTFDLTKSDDKEIENCDNIQQDIQINNNIEQQGFLQQQQQVQQQPQYQIVQNSNNQQQNLNQQVQNQQQYEDEENFEELLKKAMEESMKTFQEEQQLKNQSQVQQG
ncbi:hypothetical protein PPERSA_06671 [Pseudocohnilembus persalinus]|uniref:RING-type domain-containing protein n=1 Tax=Pseudocohnilembus persalinus TaxID=266149 RepID=A0A0V0QS61_PSEPJ|nr:hypothetical protein PPERSA_06671 [Pseudocohnilembus persalinus]|eukprot:KRX05037.1 hypothetical protein PPERSA_06671 [Pseudocohnilembus persalinus]